MVEENLRRPELMTAFKVGQIVRLENGYDKYEGHLFGKCGRVVRVHGGLMPYTPDWCGVVVFAEGEIANVAANQCSLVLETNEHAIKLLTGKGTTL